MSSVCFYFQVHQPFRLKPFSYFDTSGRLDYFDDQKNGEIARKVADKCYIPTNKLMLELIDRYEGKFKIAYSITGVAIEQMERYTPEVLELFCQLAKTGCVEFLGETYYHSLAALYDPAEFKEQVARHQSVTEALFGQRPTVFRNTELIFSDDIARLVASLGFQGVVAEGADDILGWRSPNFIYDSAAAPIKLLLKNYRLSDDVAFRFSNRGWAEWPLTADRYAHWIHNVSGNGDTVNLFMDYETFGEHQWSCTGIFDFMRALPGMVMQHPDWAFRTPSEVLASHPAVAPLSFHRLTSWADMERDITAWRGNRMQEQAFDICYDLGKEVKWQQDGALLDAWRRLQTSDHFYYMCTKWFADGDVHAYFSPYASPYDGFVNYMNVLRDFREQVVSRAGGRQAKRVVAG